MPRTVTALTMGDPGGIGPEIVLKLLTDVTVNAITQIIVVGNAGVLRRHAKLLKLPFDLPEVHVDHLVREKLSRPVLLNVPGSDPKTIPPGRPSAAGGELSMECVHAALKLVNQGIADALVTAPINKEALGLADIPWAGHTDFLQEHTGADNAVMMLVGGGLRVGVATHHVALCDAYKYITTDRLVDMLRIMDADLTRYFGIAKPRIAVTGLNPHASDGGRFGDEEEKIITPAIDAARSEDVHCEGPFAADTLFVDRFRKPWDAILAMYHDQGLIPLKMLAFGRAVNLTLGLPIVRTSVDHGTAYDIVGRGVASTDSLEEAVKLAADIVERLAR